jgi:type II secretory pathway pseudopilin PulG
LGVTSIRARRRGFTLPLTLALAFSIMSVAAALTAAVTVRAKAAHQRDADVFAAITLESAVQAALLGLEKDGVPQTDRWAARQALNGRTVQLTFLAVRYKPDVNGDPPQVLAGAILDRALSAKAVAALASPAAPLERTQFVRIRDFITAAGATGGQQEDCLRALLTLDRGGPLEPPPRRTALAPEHIPLVPGDVVEVRATIASDRYQDVLWQRLRFGGGKGQAWHIHDWRRLRLAPGASLCAPPG